MFFFYYFLTNITSCRATATSLLRYSYNNNYYKRYLIVFCDTRNFTFMIGDLSFG